MTKRTIGLIAGIFLISCVSVFGGGNSEPTAQTPNSQGGAADRTVRNSTLVNGFKVLTPSYDLVSIDGRMNVIKIDGASSEWDAMEYSLAEYKGKPVTIYFSADVMRTGPGRGVVWFLNNRDDLNFASNWGVDSEVWYPMSGSFTVIPTGRNGDTPRIRMSKTERYNRGSFFYIDNLSITIEELTGYTPANVLAQAGTANSNGTRSYYASASNGTDSGNGTQASPFAKVGHALYYAKPGDTVLVDSGTYHERLMMPSGEAGKPITLTAMPGADVTITPTVQITPQWRTHNGNIYVADISEYISKMDTEFPQLFADADSMVEARWPNMGGPSLSMIHDMDRNNARATAQAGTNRNTVVAGENIPSDLAGARVVLWPGEGWRGFDTATSIVQSVSNRAMKIAPDIATPDKSEPDSYEPYPGSPFFVTGALSLLDAPGEYYFDRKTSLLYFYPPWDGSPDTHSLALRGKGDMAIYAENTSYVNIKDIKFLGGGINMKDTSNNTLVNCRINYAQHFYLPGIDGFADWQPRMYSMIVSGSNHRIEHCEFGPTAGSGIYLKGENIVFTNNIVHDTSYAGFTFSGITVDESKNLEISRSTITNSTHSHIDFVHGGYGEDMTVFERCIVRNNYLAHHATLNTDSGAFYTFGSDGGGTEVYNNFVVVGNKNAFKDARNGLYLDGFCMNYIIHHNIVDGGNTGDVGLSMALWSKGGNRFYNNTVIGFQDAIRFASSYIDIDDASTCSFTDNLVVDIKGGDFACQGDDDFWGYFVNGTIPAPRNPEWRVQSSGNARGTVDEQYRPTGNTPNVGAIPRNGTLFPYGANWSL